jgi:hypothetical protein
MMIVQWVLFLAVPALLVAIANRKQVQTEGTTNLWEYYVQGVASAGNI